MLSSSSSSSSSQTQTSLRRRRNHRSFYTSSVVMTMTMMMMMMLLSSTSNTFRSGGGGGVVVTALNFPTPQPTDEPGVFCLICKGGDMSMGTGSISGFLCQDLDMMGRERMFDQERCVELQTRAAQDDDPCGCHPSTPSTYMIFLFEGGEKRMCCCFVVFLFTSSFYVCARSEISNPPPKTADLLYGTILLTKHMSYCSCSSFL